MLGGPGAADPRREQRLAAGGHAPRGERRAPTVAEVLEGSE